ncbi:hypothetical protein KG091_03230 [Carnobacteriaceae bacterium zg-ZUI78]|uniref:hypothetical protein n=1 Tax=Granulicatella sp. zg-84 TaxID=2678503 RepID=UPI0013C0E014|nr:hypothetical protein [Granulicatella sp. zg-84]MBS4750088.1 hypothetical protein [Carnobacteriaceae bacterium zg-ZUI78]NEW66613.1 hypothetical protein [Granulicatella sp. zg-84]QMI86264.1 hypothetical protein H1220_02605 [Carnobacteriaceae bacterium zg-84]
MTTVVESFDALFAERKVPVTKTDIGDGLVLYNVDFRLKATHTLRLEMILENNKEETDIQIVYRHVGFLKNYNQKDEVISLINQLNEMKTGYYTLFLAGDGELYLRKLVRSNYQVKPVYDMLIQGPAIVRALLEDLEAITGAFDDALFE